MKGFVGIVLIGMLGIKCLVCLLNERNELGFHLVDFNSLF